MKSGPDTAEALWEWVLWARRSRLEPFVKLQRSIVKHWDAIIAAAEHHLSNGLVESMNTKIRLITRIAFGFKRAVCDVMPYLSSPERVGPQHPR